MHTSVNSELKFTAPRVLNEVFPTSVEPCKQVSEPTSESAYTSFEKPTPENPLILCCHSGSFHADEVLATTLLTLLFGEKNVIVVRTRDPALIEKSQIVIDVGAVYDPKRHRYDHHQREFNDTFSPDYNIRLSSSGLVWKHFGKDILRIVYHVTDEALLDRFYNKLYSSFFEHIDGIDNGVEVADGKLNYKISTSLSSRVSSVNPSWRDTSPDYAERFKKAMYMAFEEFNIKAQKYAVDWVLCREIVQEAFEKRQQVDPSGEVVLFDKFCPWQEHLFDLEKKANVEGQVKYVLFQDQSGKWRIQAVPEALGSFSSRKALPEAWRGIRNKELDEITGLNDCVFVHAAGFMGGHGNYEGVLKMARMALKGVVKVDQL